MVLHIPDKTAFITNFLKPINRFAESGIVRILPDKLEGLVASIDNTTILYAQFLLANENADKSTINIPNIDKLINCLKLVDSDVVDLKINTNNIQYSSSGIKFKFHLYEDGILSMPKINIEKVNSFKYDINFEIDSSTIDKLVKSSLVGGDINKIYLYSGEDNDIYAELTDRTIGNCDAVSFKIVSGYGGEPIPEPIPLMLDAIRSFSLIKSNVSVSINREYGIVRFTVLTNQSILQYIVTSVVA